MIQRRTFTLSLVFFVISERVLITARELPLSEGKSLRNFETRSVRPRKLRCMVTNEESGVDEEQVCELEDDIEALESTPVCAVVSYPDPADMSTLTAKRYCMKFQEFSFRSTQCRESECVLSKGDGRPASFCCCHSNNCNQQFTYSQPAERK